MSYFENFLNANKAYVDLHGTAHLPLKPKTKVAIVTCMDSRLHVAQALGLALGDAHILRNAGGRVTEDMIQIVVLRPLRTMSLPPISIKNLVLMFLIKIFFHSQM